MNITRITRPSALRLVIAAVIMAIVGLLIPLSQVASARTARAAAANDSPKPRIVLLHGAWADTSSWDGVIRRLQADGYTVYAPPDPLQGLPYDTAYLADFLHTIPGPIVLVGHSYGGAVITNAATGNPQVKALVYVDAFVPAQGQSLAQLLASHPGSCAVPANLKVVPFPGAPSGVGDAYIKQSAFPSCMADGLPATEAHVLAVTQLPIATIALDSKERCPGVEDNPVVGRGRHRRPRHPAALAASHGPPGARPHHQGRRAAPLHDLQSRNRDERDPASRPGDLLAQAFGLRQQQARSTDDACRRHPRGRHHLSAA